MSIDRLILGLPESIIAALDLEIRHVSEGAIVDSNAGEMFEIINGVSADKHPDSSKYMAKFCFTGHSGEAQVTEIKAKATDNTLGFIFPITSFRDGGIIDGIWTKRYADVAFRFAVSIDHLGRFGRSVSLESLRGKSVFLDDIFSDDICLLVVGLGNLEKNAISRETLEMMLLKHHTYMLSDITETSHMKSEDEFRRVISVPKLSEIVSEEAKIFTGLIRGADRDYGGVGAFMSLYQSIEFCIDHIFGWSVGSIPALGLNTWETKEFLSSVSGERYRLSLLDSSCLLPNVDREPFQELGARCREFLSSMGIAEDEDKNWFQLLYLSRNIVVHNQIKMLKAQNAPLKEVNVELRRSVFSILSSFNKPDDDRVFYRKRSSERHGVA